MDDRSSTPYFQGAYSYDQPQATWPVNMNTQIGNQTQGFDQNATPSYNNPSHYGNEMMTYSEQTSNFVLNPYPVYPSYDTGMAYPNSYSTAVVTDPYESGALDIYQSNLILSTPLIDTFYYEASTLAGQLPISGGTSLSVTSNEEGAFLYPHQSTNLVLDSTFIHNSDHGALTFAEQLPSLNNALPLVDPYFNAGLISAEEYFGHPSVNPVHDGGMTYLETSPTQPHDPLPGKAHINLTPGSPMEGASQPIPPDSGVNQAPVARNKRKKPAVIYRCQFEGCTKVARDAHNLRTHEYKHKPASFFCLEKGCGKKFKFPSDLHRHHETIHKLNRVCNKQARKKDTKTPAVQGGRKKLKSTF